MIVSCKFLFILKLQAAFAMNDNWRAERFTNRVNSAIKGEKCNFCLDYLELFSLNFNFNTLNN